MINLKWLAWRLPNNVQVLRTQGGLEKRNVKRTVWNWFIWRMTR